MDNSSNNNFRSSIEDISNIDDVALDFSVPINQNSKKLNSFEKLKMYLNNVSLQSERRYNAVYFKSNIVKFSKYLIKKNSKRRYLYTALLAMLTAVITVFLVQNSGLYTAGFSGVFQGIARIVQAAMLKANVNEYSVNIIYNLLFWGLYFVANIPLLIFSYKKISKEFTYLTIIYIVFNQLTGLALSQIPDIHNIYIFGNTTADIGGLEFVKLTPWNGFESFLLLIYSIISGLLFALPYTLIYIFSGCTGGSDVVSIYYAIQKNRNIGSIIIIVNIICLMIATLLGSFGAQALYDWNILIGDASTSTKATSLVVQAIFSPNLIFSFVTSTIIGFIVNYFFPRMKFVQVKVFTPNVAEMRDKFLDAGYKHDIYFNKSVNAINNESFDILETICMYVELPNLLAMIRNIDKTSIISINRLSDIDGEMYILK